MKKYLSSVLIAGSVCLATLIAFSTKTVKADVSPGQAVPDFSLTDSEQQKHALSDYRGKYVILEWVNHDCPFVRKHYDSGNMQALQKKYRALGVVWLSVNSSSPGKQGHCSPEQAGQLTQEKGADPDAVLLDPDGAVGRMYGAQTTPHMFIIDPEGTLIYQGAIDDKPTTDPQDIADSVNYVTQAMDEAVAGKKVSVAATKSYGCSVKY
ncbi:MAG: thioredoxin family protein [Candidatus Omnitrophota bacterium]|nr:thioredoxin family protein [Candidatus Omnitrophota bacterium]MDZ4242796.1 thioredoxin family protein [Candidatus Omnitrophota bacterium]